MFKPKNEALLECGCSWPLLLRINGGGYSRPETMQPSSAKWNEQIRGLKTTFQSSAGKKSGFWRIKGQCPNSECQQSFEIHCKEAEADKIATLIFFEPVSPDEFQVVQGKVKSSPTRKRNLTWVDWIPSPRGPKHYQRLILDDDRKEFFALAATGSIKIGLPFSLYPDWYPEADAVQFGEWAEDLYEKTGDYELDLQIKMKSVSNEFLTDYKESLKPEIARYCHAVQKARMEQHRQIESPAYTRKKRRILCG